jgi:hypothetical protein
MPAIEYASTVRENTTQSLNSAISNVDSSYNSTDAIAVFVTEARQENGYDIVIQPLVRIFRYIEDDLPHTEYIYRLQECLQKFAKSLLPNLHLNWRQTPT